MAIDIDTPRSDIVRTLCNAVNRGERKEIIGRKGKLDVLRVSGWQKFRRKGQSSRAWQWQWQRVMGVNAPQ